MNRARFMGYILIIRIEGSGVRGRSDFFAILELIYWVMEGCLWSFRDFRTQILGNGGGFGSFCDSKIQILGNRGVFVLFSRFLESNESNTGRKNRAKGKFHTY